MVGGAKLAGCFDLGEEPKLEVEDSRRNWACGMDLKDPRPSVLLERTRNRGSDGDAMIDMQKETVLRSSTVEFRE